MMKGWRTLIFSAGLALIGVLQAADWVNLLGAAKAGYVVAAIGMASAALRFFTDTKVGQSN